MSSSVPHQGGIRQDALAEMKRVLGVLAESALMYGEYPGWMFHADEAEKRVQLIASALAAIKHVHGTVLRVEFYYLYGKNPANVSSDDLVSEIVRQVDALCKKAIAELAALPQDETWDMAFEAIFERLSEELERIAQALSAPDGSSSAFRAYRKALVAARRAMP
jgi:hypothetical protein